MTARHLALLTALLAPAAHLAAQNATPGTMTAPTPGLPAGAFRSTPTLSPYLNTFNRGGNAAVNYYNFTRPYTQAFGGVAGPGANIAGGQRSTFFPQGSLALPEDTAFDPAVDEPASGRSAISTAGHVTYFNNTFGYFGGTRTGAGRAPAAALGQPRRGR